MIKRCLKQYASANARFSETHLKDEPFFKAASLPSIVSDMPKIKGNYIPVVLKDGSVAESD